MLPLPSSPAGRTIHWAFIVAWLSATPALGQAPSDLRLPAPRFPDAVQLLNAGEFDTALAVLQRGLADEPYESVEARLLRAQILNNAGRVDESEALWSALGSEERALRAFALSRLIENTVNRGAADLADNHLNSLTNGRPQRGDLPLLMTVADLLTETGRPERAEARYRQALSLVRTGPTADRAKLGLASLHEETGDIDRALALYRNVQLQFRSAAAFVEARTAARRLVRARPVTPFTSDQYGEMVRRLRRTARYRTALELLNEWAKVHTNADEQARIDLERVETLYAMRSNEEAIAACIAFSSRYPSHPQVSQVHLIRFRLAVRLGRTDEVRTLGGNLWAGQIAGTPLSIRRDTGTLLAAYLVAVGLVDEGLDVYRELFRITRAAGAQRTILWRAGVAALEAGQLTRAATNLRSLVRRRPTGELAPAALYWLGVTEQRLGRIGAASEAFQSLTARYPYHYYGIRGFRRLAEESLVNGEDERPRKRNSFPNLALTTATLNAPEFQAARFLAQAGLSLDAAETVWNLLQRRSHDKGLAFLTAIALARSSDHDRAARVITNHFGEFLRQPADNLPKDFWGLVFPRPFRAEVEAAAEANGLDPLMLFAIMRQESRFDPKARSAVGALGLFQIMPDTAAVIGPAVGVGDVSRDEAAMLEPSVNAAIGARLAKRLLTMFDGTLAPVAASYNAGESLAQVWWNAADGLREDYFVDAIPYSETRRFVREVLTNYASYQRLYGNTPP